MDDYEKNELKNYLRDYCDARLEPTQKKDFYICPFCQSGTGPNRTAAFHLFTTKEGELRYKCSAGDCLQTGDLYSLIMHCEGLTFTQALDRARELYGNPGSVKPMLSRMVTIPKKPKIIQVTAKQPTDEWQQAVLPIVRRAQDFIFEDAGRDALDYLHSRGIDDETIKAHKIGYIPPVKNDEFCKKWGYAYSITSPIPNDSKKLMAIPYGITMPYFMDGTLYKLKTRRLPEQVNGTVEKIGQVRDGQTAIFNADDAACKDKRRDIIFTEGEIDAMSINQAVGRWCNDEIKAVTCGSATDICDANEFYRWYVMPYRVIVAFDNDDAGKEGAKKLAEQITLARLDAGRDPARIENPPERYNDWNAFLMDDPRSVFQYVSDKLPVNE